MTASLARSRSGSRCSSASGRSARSGSIVLPSLLCGWPDDAEHRRDRRAVDVRVEQADARAGAREREREVRRRPCSCRRRPCRSSPARCSSRRGPGRRRPSGRIGTCRSQSIVERRAGRGLPARCSMRALIARLSGSDAAWIVARSATPSPLDAHVVDQAELAASGLSKVGCIDLSGAVALRAHSSRRSGRPSAGAIPRPRAGPRQAARRRCGVRFRVCSRRHARPSASASAGRCPSRSSRYAPAIYVATLGPRVRGPLGQRALRPSRATACCTASSRCVADKPPGDNDWAHYEGRWYVSFPPFPAVVIAPLVALFGHRGLGPAVLGDPRRARARAALRAAAARCASAATSERSVREDLALTALFAFGSVLLLHRRSGHGLVRRARRGLRADRAVPAVRARRAAAAAAPASRSGSRS